MKNTLKLINPIKINNKDVAEMDYDTNEITVALFAEAEGKRKVAAGMKNVGITPAAEFDYGLHIYIGMAAIIAVNPDYDFSDLERIKGHDTVALMGIGRNFILKSEPESPESDSGELAATTPESTTQAPPTSKKND